jgi:hypothetical protein
MPGGEGPVLVQAEGVSKYAPLGDSYITITDGPWSKDLSHDRYLTIGERASFRPQSEPKLDDFRPANEIKQVPKQRVNPEYISGRRRFYGHTQQRATKAPGSLGQIADQVCEP